MHFSTSQGVLHGTSRLQTSIAPTNGQPTVIPFVTPASPFVPQPAHHQLLPQAPLLSTSNSTSTTRASPFSSPPPPHSTSVSPISHQPLAQDLAVALQQHQQGQSPHDHSHPSARSSPHPSLPSGLSHPHPGPLPLGRSPPHRSNSNPSHTHPYYLPPHPQGPITDADPQQVFGQAPLPHHTTTHQGLPAPALSLQDLEQYQAWARLGGQSYPFGLPSELDGSAGVSSPYADSAAAMEAARMQEEQTNRHLPADTTPRFPSTHPPPAGPPPQRRTPPNPQLSGTHLARQTLGSDLTLDPTTMTAHVSGANGSAEMHLAAQLAAAGGTTSTGQSLGPSLDGSPSWNSAMTHLQMQQQLDHLYRYQPQVARQPQVHSRGPPHLQDSSHPQHNSHSSIAPASVPLRQQIAQNPHLAARAHHYSLELHRQQQEQLRQRLQQQQQREETAEQERRNSEEYMRLAQLYGQGPLSGSPHHMGAPSAAYFPQQQADNSNNNHFQDGLPPHVRHPSHQPLLHAHSGVHHPQQVMHLPPHLAHQAILDGGYPLPDGVGQDPLELGVLGPGGSPTGMIKYESPLPLE